MVKDWDLSETKLEELGVYDDVIEFGEVKESDKTIIDIGTGHGNLLPRLFSPGRILIGTDVSINALEHASRRLSKSGISSKVYTTFFSTIKIGDRWRGIHEVPSNIELDKVILLEDDIRYSLLRKLIIKHPRIGFADKIFYVFSGGGFEEIPTPVAPDVSTILSDNGELVVYNRFFIIPGYEEKYKGYLSDITGLTVSKFELDQSEYAKKTVATSFEHAKAGVTLVPLGLQEKSDFRNYEDFQRYMRSGGYEFGLLKVKLKL